MKSALLFLLAAFFVNPAHGEEICRSVSTSWQSGDQKLATRISTQAVDGCKLLFNIAGGVETEGYDCNCDLVIDGMEDEFSPPPSARQAERLFEVCHGPSVDPKPDVPEIVIMDGH